jgi:hypothetical protein
MYGSMSVPARSANGTKQPQRNQVIYYNHYLFRKKDGLK